MVKGGVLRFGGAAIMRGRAPVGEAVSFPTTDVRAQGREANSFPYRIPLTPHRSACGRMAGNIASLIGTVLLCVTATGEVAPPLFPEPMDASEIQLALQKLNVL